MQQALQLKQCLEHLHQIEEFICKNREAKSDKAAETYKKIYESASAISILSDKAYQKFKF